jgi:SAM-dependent methyltransferase
LRRKPEVMTEDGNNRLIHEPYAELAAVYDEMLPDEEFYAQWLALLRAEWHSTQPASVVDLGCGTGVLAVAMAQAGWSVIGVDGSEAMLAVASERAIEERATVSLRCMDLRSFHLSSPVEVAVCTRDVLNYLLTESDLECVVRRVHDALVPGGKFFFDVLGPKRVRQLADGVWHVVTDATVLLHLTEVAGECGRPIISHDITCFSKVDDGYYERFDECHLQRFYTASVLASVLLRQGFQVAAVYSDFHKHNAVLGAERTTLDSVDFDDADRMMFVWERLG